MYASREVGQCAGFGRKQLNDGPYISTWGALLGQKTQEWSAAHLLVDSLWKQLADQFLRKRINA